MKFENTVSHSPSRWSVARDHLPLLAFGGGAVALFLGLHMAATGVMILAALHVAVGLGAVAVQQLRKSRRGATRRATAEG